MNNSIARSPGENLTQPMGPSLRVSVLMPVYNEAATVAHAISRVRTLPLEMEIICVDDCSTDGTREKLQELLEAGQIDHLVLHETNRGKGAGIRSALSRASGDVVVVQDADLEYDPADIMKLIGPVQDGRADAVFGSRFRGEVSRVLYYWHSLGNGTLTMLSNMVTNLNLTDMETCYKLVRTDLMRSLPLTSDRFGFEPELTARLAQARARIYEVPISYSGRTYAEGKKIRWTDGVAALWHIVRSNFFSEKAPIYQPPSPIAD
ncbi:MAG: glycosyltransferase family 2 protein [Gemmatimonadaceae bacterium]